MLPAPSKWNWSWNRPSEIWLRPRPTKRPSGKSGGTPYMVVLGSRLTTNLSGPAPPRHAMITGNAPLRCGVRCSARLGGGIATCLRKVDEIDARTGDKYDFVLSNNEHGENVHGLQGTTMPARKTDKTSKPA